MSITENPDLSSGIITLFNKVAEKWFYFGKALHGKDFILSGPLRTITPADRTPNNSLGWENHRISKWEKTLKVIQGPGLKVGRDEGK